MENSQTRVVSDPEVVPHSANITPAVESFELLRSPNHAVILNDHDTKHNPSIAEMALELAQRARRQSAMIVEKAEEFLHGAESDNGPASQPEIEPVQPPVSAEATAAMEANKTDNA